MLSQRPLKSEVLDEKNYSINFFFYSGCFAQDFREQTNSPYSGYINTIAISSSDHIFVGATTGVYRSIDNGNRWTQTGLITDVMCK